MSGKSFKEWSFCVSNSKLIATNSFIPPDEQALPVYIKFFFFINQKFKVFFKNLYKKQAFEKPN